jgi:hypothetical protein
LAAVLADQIADWRSATAIPLPLGAKAGQYVAAGRRWGPPDRPFRGTDELGLVLAMTPDLLARLRPYVSPYIDSAPKFAISEPIVARALAEAAAAGSPPNPLTEPPTVMIIAAAESADGGRFTRRAVVRLNIGPAAESGQPLYLVLDWDQ